MAAILIDLAVRGYVRFEETRDHRREVAQTLTRTEWTTDDLEPYEARILEAAFATDDSVTVRRLRTRAGALGRPVFDLLERQMWERGRLRRPARAQRVGSTVIAGGLAAVAVVLGVAAFGSGTAAGVSTAGLAWAALALVVAAAVFGLYLRFQVPYSDSGARMLAVVDAYAEALGTWPGERSAFPGTAVVGAAFPYAIAFGQPAGWQSGWGDILAEATPQLSWYVIEDGTDRDQAASRMRRLGDITRSRAPYGRKGGGGSGGWFQTSGVSGGSSWGGGAVGGGGGDSW